MDHKLENLSRDEILPQVTDLRGTKQRLPLWRWLERLAFVAFCSLLVLAPFRLRLYAFERPQPPLYTDFTGFLLFASDLALLALLLCWILSLVLRPKGARVLRYGPPFLTMPLAGLLVFSAISLPFSVDPPLSLYHLLRLLALAGLALYVRNSISTLHQVAIPAASSLVVQSLVATGQALRQSDLGLQFLGEYSLDPAWSGVSILLRDGERWLRAYGLSDHPNILGGCLAFSLLLLAVWIVERQPGPGLALAHATFGLGVAALLVSFSRAAWLAWMVGLLWLAAVWSWRRSRVQLFVLAGLLAAALLWSAPFAWVYQDLIGVRLNSRGSFSSVPVEQQALGERLVLNQAANQVFLNKPLTGVGLGALPRALQQLYPNFPLDYQPAHLVLLDVAAETGLFAALCYLLLQITPWLALWLNRRRLAFSPLFLGATALLLALALVSLLDYYPWLNSAGRTWQWLAWGLWGAAYDV